ncbi:hypothetical protein JXA88_12280 [Candidatus Fermentibacteria bacterium]|nr:hypothetical protein [Candidatus Fermentibacteria bacterium]
MSEAVGCFGNESSVNGIIVTAVVPALVLGRDTRLCGRDFSGSRHEAHHGV